MTADAYDYVIVGAGSAGCVLAERLSERGDRSVVVIESGPADTSPLIAMPMGIGAILKPGSRHCWEFTASQGGNRPQEKWVKGRALGGSSSVNGMVYIRGMPGDYDGWAAQGCAGWGWDEIGRCFAALEDHELGPGGGRGVGGPLRISMPSRRDPLSIAVLAATARAGWPTVTDINDPVAATQGGFGSQPCTIWRGRRFSAATAFLARARRRPNLDILTDTDVLALEFDGRVATGVTLRHRGQTRRIAARAEVILCAGALNSPKLLQLAGIGPAPLLAGLGIPVRVDAPEIGRNLREHRGIQIGFRLTRGGHNASLRGPGLVASAIRYALTRRGPLANGVMDVSGNVKTAPGLDRTDAQIAFGFFSFTATGGEDHHPFSGRAVAKHPGMTMFGCMLRPESRGEIAIRSRDPDAPPRIDANYLSAETDRAGTIALVREMRRIAAQPQLLPFVAEETLPGPRCESDDDIVEAVFRFGTPGYHVSGTCRMGSDERAPLDPDLRVKGVDHLRVVDTSIMPTLVSGNTNGPAMAIAWRAAELIRTASR